MDGFSIVATINDRKLLKSIEMAGATAIRFNSSHVTLEELEKFTSYYEDTCSLPLYIDLQGAKLRLSRNQPVMEIKAGEQVTLGSQCSHLKAIAIDPRTLSYLSPGMKISIEDGRIELQVLKQETDNARAIVLRGGVIRASKGMNISPHPINQIELSSRDSDIVLATRKYDFVRYALSFVSSPSEVIELKDLSGRPVTSKIERELPFSRVGEISSSSDEIWLCRGDLGAQLGARGLVDFYSYFSDNINELYKPVLMAGEVLEHMVDHPFATRSELCHLKDIQMKGFAGIVLSNETAYGTFPIEAIKTVLEVTSDE
ncbi:pyruvate kinase [Mesotoga sp.]|jgi:pyruvate kinase|uniref:pyruvate kinase n=1 Tax=Mesotoga sp. TaxID=2053577 RepID=UPI00345ED2E3